MAFLNKQISRFHRRRWVILAMLPLAILNGQPVVGCICADGTFKTDCPAMRETAKHVDTNDCCGAGCCAGHDVPEPSHSCCDGAAPEKNGDHSQRTGHAELAGNGCCQPAVDAPVPPPLVSAVQVADEHHSPALAILPIDAFPPLDALSAARQVEDDTGCPPTDLVITLRHLLI